MAGWLAEASAADIRELETVRPYTGSCKDIVAQGERKVQAGTCPALKPLALQPEDYDIIFVGTPTWWYTMAPAVRTFLTEHGLAQKTVIPFQTHGGWPGHVRQDMAKLCPKADIQEIFAVQFDDQGGPNLVRPEEEVKSGIRQLVRKYGA